MPFEFAPARRLDSRAERGDVHAAIYAEPVRSDEPNHVFISYVHEGNDEVDKLCRVLEAAGILYWRDRNDLGPGDAWKAKIRSAVRDGALVFIACFSDQSRAKQKPL